MTDSSFYKSQLQKKVIDRVKLLARLSRELLAAKFLNSAVRKDRDVFNSFRKK